MAKLKRETLKRIVGEVDDRTLSDIQATGAGMKDIEEAKAIATGKSDITGSGEQALPGVIKEVLTILQGRAEHLGADYHRALLDPPAVYAQPAQVLADTALTAVQKIEILRRWEYDAREISVAEDEGMPACDTDVLAQILQALETLVGDIDTDHTPPTKQGGLNRAALKPKNGKT